jgi:hypothetical protein
MLKQHDEERSPELEAAGELLVNLSHTVEEQEECWRLSPGSPAAVTRPAMPNGERISRLQPLSLH